MKKRLLSLLLLSVPCSLQGNTVVSFLSEMEQINIRTKAKKILLEKDRNRLGEIKAGMFRATLEEYEEAMQGIKGASIEKILPLGSFIGKSEHAEKIFKKYSDSLNQQQSLAAITAYKDSKKIQSISNDKAVLLRVKELVKSKFKDVALISSAYYLTSLKKSKQSLEPAIVAYERVKKLYSKTSDTKQTDVEEFWFTMTDKMIDGAERLQPAKERLLPAYELLSQHYGISIWDKTDY